MSTPHSEDVDDDVETSRSITVSSFPELRSDERIDEAVEDFSEETPVLTFDKLEAVTITESALLLCSLAISQSIARLTFPFAVRGMALTKCHDVGTE